MYGKIIDTLILNRHTDKLSSSNLQFGFKVHHSTNQNTFVAKKVIQYYLNNCSEVYSCTLAIQKPPNKVDLLKLFAKLKAWHLPIHILQLLFSLQYDFSLRIYWHDTFSAFLRPTTEQSRARSYLQFYFQSSLMTFLMASKNKASAAL